MSYYRPTRADIIARNRKRLAELRADPRVIESIEAERRRSIVRIANIAYAAGRKAGPPTRPRTR